MSRCKLRTPWPIHFKLRIVIGIDSLMVCIPFGEISMFHSRVMRLYSSNCRRFFVCLAVNWEPLGQFTSNFAQLFELIVLRSVYILVKFRFFIQELWERKSCINVDDGRIMRSWHSCLFMFAARWPDLIYNKCSKMFLDDKKNIYKHLIVKTNIYATYFFLLLFTVYWPITIVLMNMKVNMMFVRILS